MASSMSFCLETVTSPLSDKSELQKVQADSFGGCSSMLDPRPSVNHLLMGVCLFQTNVIGLPASDGRTSNLGRSMVPFLSTGRGTYFQFGLELE